MTDSLKTVGGMLNRYDIRRNVELIRSLYPQVENIALVTDNTYGGISLQALVREEWKNYPDLNLVLVDSREGDEAVHETYASLPPRSAVMLGTWRVGSDGEYFMQRSLNDLVQSNPRIPVFSITRTSIGDVAIGGYVPEYENGAPLIAAQIKKYYDTGKIDDVRFHTSKNIYLFDSRKLKDWKIAEYALPKGSVVEDAIATKLSKYSHYIELLVLGILLLVVLLLFVSLNVHPGSEAVSTAAGSAKSDLVGRLNVYMNNAASDALGELAYIKKQYTIDYSATSAPKPDESRFVTYSIDEADKVMDVIEQARTFGLLDGQDVIFNPSVEFYWDSDIRCYCDETILAICWKEKINDRVCSFVEVKLADGSQIRRKLVNDTFGSNEKAVASELSRSANAVIAMNADYYKYRDLGVCVYQGQLCRYETSCDVLFIDSNGDFRMLRASELGSREDVEQYIADNNIQFSMSFGPILVRDGVLQQLTGSYAGGIGEMYEQYSRSGIGQYDKLHYLVMTVNHSQDGTPRATVNQFAEIIYGKGVQNAYNFDGGQTSEVLINNERYNYVDWDNEREVSDILYFATAIPEQEVG